VHALRILALQGTPIEEIVGRADTVLSSQSADIVATVVVVRYDPELGIARLASGGHPPAILAAADGSVRQVPAPGGAIGWPGAGSDAVAEVALEPGDSLVLYTDGLVESKKDIIAGQEALCRYAQELASQPAQVMADGLVTRALLDGDRRDDSLAMVLRRTPVAAERESWTIPADPRQAHEAHAELASWLSLRHVEVADVAAIRLIAAELLSNATRAARSSVSLRVELDRERIVIEVEDDGEGSPDLQHQGLRPPEPMQDTGRGLFIVRTLSDEVSVLSTFESSVVKATRRLGRDAHSGGDSISAVRGATPRTAPYAS
ncbi:MAG: SpoIIE family protein phosphatase, partial [Actinobacteria bacterium]|nr:SpoIIE family protein phosphatase [Actinomycetota bacterium]